MNGVKVFMKGYHKVAINQNSVYLCLGFCIQPVLACMNGFPPELVDVEHHLKKQIQQMQNATFL